MKPVVGISSRKIIQPTLLRRRIRAWQWVMWAWVYVMIDSMSSDALAIYICRPYNILHRGIV